MKKITSIIFVSAFLLSGCEIIGPSAKVEPPKVKVESTSSENNGKFCPPGQAKKGKC